MRLLKSIFFAILLFCSLSSAASAENEEIFDPLEPMNRAIFWFNDTVEVYVLTPAAKGYDAITPTVVQKGIGNFFENIRYPIYLISDLFQFKFKQAGVHTGRFLINTTIGIGGLIDVAEDWGLEKHREDFGTALGYYGVPSGPYIVLPFLGPSNLRDATGRVVDFFLYPLSWFRYTDESDAVRVALPLGLATLEAIDETNRAQENIKLAKESALDYYLFMQAAYEQHRKSLIYDGSPPGEDEFGDEEFGDDFEDGTAENPPSEDGPESNSDELAE